MLILRGFQGGAGVGPGRMGWCGGAQWGNFDSLCYLVDGGLADGSKKQKQALYVAAYDAAG